MPGHYGRGHRSCHLLPVVLLGQYAPETRLGRVPACPVVSLGSTTATHSYSRPGTKQGGWGSMPQGQEPRLSCGVASLHHSHPSSGDGKLPFRSAVPREVSVRLMEQGHDRPRLLIPAPDHAGRSAFSPDGLHIALGHADGTVTVPDLAEIQRRLAEFHMGW